MVETFCNFGKILFPDPLVDWLMELPEDEELGLSFGSLALWLLWKVCGFAPEASELESKLAEPNSRPHLLPRMLLGRATVVFTPVLLLSSFSATEDNFVVERTLEIVLSPPRRKIDLVSVFVNI